MSQLDQLALIVELVQNYPNIKTMTETLPGCIGLHVIHRVQISLILHDLNGRRLMSHPSDLLVVLVAQLEMKVEQSFNLRDSSHWDSGGQPVL